MALPLNSDGTPLSPRSFFAFLSGSQFVEPCNLGPTITPLICMVNPLPPLNIHHESLNQDIFYCEEIDHISNSNINGVRFFNNNQLVNELVWLYFNYIYVSVIRYDCYWTWGILTISMWRTCYVTLADSCHVIQHIKISVFTCMVSPITHVRSS